MKPILKWAGGKSRLVDDVISYFPYDYKKRVYHEPFFGGGAVFFNIEQSKGTINDINTKLISFYEVVRDNPIGLIEAASQYEYDKDVYYELRTIFNSGELDKVEEAAIFLYLNKTGFNGLYRVNSKNEFNVPFGRYTNPTIVPKNEIMKASQLLQDISMYCQDFDYVLNTSQVGDFCYFDPPYQPVSTTSNFTSYSPDGFDLADQTRLYELCQSLHEKGVSFVMSNSAASEIYDMYSQKDEFTIRYIEINRLINSDATKRGGVKEIIVTNVPMKQWYKLRFTTFL